MKTNRDKLLLPEGLLFPRAWTAGPDEPADVTCPRCGEDKYAGRQCPHCGGWKDR